MYSWSGGPFAGPVARGELVGQAGEQDDSWRSSPRSCQTLSSPPGMVARIALSRLRAPNIAFGGGRLLDPQRQGGLGQAHLLEMPQGQDFAVDRVEGVERFLKPHHPLGPDGRLRRRGVLAQELGRQRRR